MFEYRTATLKSRRSGMLYAIECMDPEGDGNWYVVCHTSQLWGDMPHIYFNIRHAQKTLRLIKSYKDSEKFKWRVKPYRRFVDA